MQCDLEEPWTGHVSRLHVDVLAFRVEIGLFQADVGVLEALRDHGEPLGERPPPEFSGPDNPIGEHVATMGANTLARAGILCDAETGSHRLAERGNLEGEPLKELPVSGLDDLDDGRMVVLAHVQHDRVTAPILGRIGQGFELKRQTRPAEPAPSSRTTAIFTCGSMMGRDEERRGQQPPHGHFAKMASASRGDAAPITNRTAAEACKPCLPAGPLQAVQVGFHE
jgi:hypothetical protein